MSPQDLAVLIGIFFAVTLTGGLIMDWFEKRRKK